ncbi:MAG: helix-turn-helix transcriptional regulator [Eubacterium sp.]|nr:helix-turn-helix transcriptional regulator [Eubacterium sp.]
MSLGENIQKYRKNLGMSQEELGQKLLVSRQTISLWEKDQTAPTIDNLMRLKEVFGVSVDEILGFENKIQSEENKPNEYYKFNFSEAELNQIHRSQRIAIYKRPIIFGLIFVLAIISLIVSPVSDIIIGITFSMLFFCVVFHIKGIFAYNKAWKNSVKKVCESTYEYKVFEDHILINIYRSNEKVRSSKCYFSDIERIQQLDRWLFFQFGGQSFIVRKSNLKENSAFYSFMYKNPSKTIETIPDKWRVISIILFVASLLSIFVAMPLVGMVSGTNGLFIENMWIFFLLTPIPIASTVFGFVLKSKGYKYKKNIIAGIIITILLCIYGSFIFMF